MSPTQKWHHLCQSQMHAECLEWVSFKVNFRLHLLLAPCFILVSQESGNHVAVEVMRIRRFSFLWKSDLLLWHLEAEKGTPGGNLPQVFTEPQVPSELLP